MVRYLGRILPLFARRFYKKNRTGPGCVLGLFANRFFILRGYDMKAYDRLNPIFILPVILSFVMSIPVFAQTSSFDPVGKVYEEAKQDAMGICPPIFLRNENRNIINPISGVNVDVPYSPKQTCGECHDYEKITKGYHFLQGKGEKMGKNFEQTYPWCTSPGQYGGRW